MPSLDIGGFAEAIDPKCEKALKALKSKSVDLTKTGHKEINILMKAVECQVKASGRGAKELEQYNVCHKSVMGTGAYKGQTVWWDGASTYKLHDGRILLVSA